MSPENGFRSVSWRLISDAYRAPRDHVAAIRALNGLCEFFAELGHSVKAINDTNQSQGSEAEIDDVEYVPSHQISLCEIDGELVKCRGKSK